MRLIRSERPEMSLPTNRLESWFRRPFFGGRDWMGLFDWDSLGDNFLPDTRLGADFYEDGEAYHVRMELPGISKKDLRVELENAVLTVSYDHHAREEESDEVMGSFIQSFTRSVSVPDGIAPEEVSKPKTIMVK